VSRGASVWSRTGRLEASLQQVALHRELAELDATLREAVDRVAAEMAVEPWELLVEARALVERAVAAGARTAAEVDAFALREFGMNEDDLQAEAARRRGGW
jgi:hypothetical protein